jgi:hypothetical protein
MDRETAICTTSYGTQPLVWLSNHAAADPGRKIFGGGLNRRGAQFVVQRDVIKFLAVAPPARLREEAGAAEKS